MPKPLPTIDMSAPVCCAPVAAGPADDAAALEVAIRLKALADPVRVKLMSLLFTAEEPCTTGSLAAAVDLSESTVSHHLGQLRAAGFVVSERHGMSVHHTARHEALTALCRVLDPSCCT
ncbi:Rv2640c family ArsR-like transcriptional regulator [Mycobacterium sp. pV006]|uniref:Rv2640c family ArsR-like transcriptional regulator n=1 Tax=Mycobacterium sp. pV006 TaxID=3238983 RepID=UPI00351BA82C